MTSPSNNSTTKADGVGLPFAKLFDTEHGQVLVTTEYDDEAETHSIKFRGASHKGVEPAVAFGGWATETEARDALLATDQSRADEAGEMLNNLVGRLMA